MAVPTKYTTWIYLGLALAGVTFILYMNDHWESRYRFRRPKGKSGKGATAKKRLRRSLGRGALPKKKGTGVSWLMGRSANGRFFKP
ncbi:hypothetical protein HDV03_004853 [Kappamyces sp. JEL0829]|nr:hypothetical protein HDV03_004853 [Kappamyces sp. JEL0829]KAJ3337214.1 hypothetical protein HDU91_001544 [Kappamyces sp. JEL0680]